MQPILVLFKGKPYRIIMTDGSIRHDVLLKYYAEIRSLPLGELSWLSLPVTSAAVIEKERLEKLREKLEGSLQTYCMAIIAPLFAEMMNLRDSKECVLARLLSFLDKAMERCREDMWQYMDVEDIPAELINEVAKEVATELLEKAGASVIAVSSPDFIPVEMPMFDDAVKEKQDKFVERYGRKDGTIGDLDEGYVVPLPAELPQAIHDACMLTALRVLYDMLIPQSTSEFKWKNFIRLVRLRCCEVVPTMVKGKSLRNTPKRDIAAKAEAIAEWMRMNIKKGGLPDENEEKDDTESGDG